MLNQTPAMSYNNLRMPASVAGVRSSDSQTETLHHFGGEGFFVYKFTSRKGEKRRSLFKLLEVKQSFQHLPDNSDAGTEHSNHQAISITEEGTYPASGMPIQNAPPLGSNAMMWEGQNPTY